MFSKHVSPWLCFKIKVMFYGILMKSSAFNVYGTYTVATLNYVDNF